MLKLLLLGVTVSVVPVRDYGQWDESRQEVRRWYQTLMQPDEPFKSCCGEADAYEADEFEVAGDQYVAIITNGAGDERFGKPDIPNGTKIVVPNTKVKWDRGNPTGHGIIFIGKANQVYCYITPSGT